jgi:hypothetical protein
MTHEAAIGGSRLERQRENDRNGSWSSDQLAICLPLRRHDDSDLHYNVMYTFRDVPMRLFFLRSHVHAWVA